MSNAMHVAKTGLNAQNSRMQVIANNLANYVFLEVNFNKVIKFNKWAYNGLIFRYY